MGQTFTTASDALREYYAKNVSKILFDDKQLTPLLGILEKRSGKYDASGRKFIQPIHYGDGSSVSATFSTAQSKAQGTTTGSANLYERWEVDAMNLHGVAYWDRDVLDQIQSASQMFDIGEEEINGKMREIRLDIAKGLWGTGSGALATLSASPSSTTITVSTAYVNRFNVGDDLVAAATDLGGALRSATTVNVTQINPDTGVITVGVDPTGLSWASGDYVFRAGDRENAVSPTARKLMGFGGWCPNSAPGSTSFFGVNRQGVYQLGGLRRNCTTESIKTALIKSANKLFQFGATKSTHAFISVDEYSTLCDDLDDSKHIEVKARDFSLSFDAVKVIGAHGGAIAVLPDPFCPPNEGVIGDFDNGDNAYLVYSNQLVNIDDHDGNIFLRAASAAAYEARMYFRGNLVVAAPGRFLKMTNLGA
jgi:hypothetical protein